MSFPSWRVANKNKVDLVWDGTQNTKINFQARRKFISDPLERKERFAEHYLSTSVDDRWIFYESMGGNRMMDNPYAIFKQIFEDTQFNDFIHVWSVAKHETIPEHYRNQKNILFVTRNTDTYMYALAKSKHIICNSVLPEFFVPKPEQKYLNTWHGVAYKGIGRSQLSPLGPMGTIYNMLESTHVLTPCDFMTQKQLSGFSMEGVYSGQLAETGYPRVDMTINASESEKEKLSLELGIDQDKKIVLYAPTWRGDMNSRKFDVQNLEDDLKSLCELDANIVFMGHHLMLKSLKGVSFEGIIIPPTSINTNLLLSITDILITDYSSIFFDFLVTGRPIVHYVYDYDEYQRERGLNLEINDLPGVIVRRSSELIKAVSEFLAAPYIPTKKYRIALERFCPHEDGKVSERVVKWFFGGETVGVNTISPDNRKTVLFWGGALNNSEYAIKYLGGIKEYIKDKNTRVVLVVARSVAKRPEIMEIINKFGLDITVVARGGEAMVATRSEQLARKLIEHGIRGWGRVPFVRKRYTRLYQREYRRVFGNARFDKVILYPKCSRFWKELVKYAA